MMRRSDVKWTAGFALVYLAVVLGVFTPGLLRHVPLLRKSIKGPVPFSDGL